jgi:formylglycine-generating enzyme required for sulfatase activity
VKAAFLTTILLFSALCFAQTPAGNQKPLGKNQILDLLKAGMESEVLAKTVQERGIDFEPSDEDLAALRKAGAQDVLIKALRTAKPRPLTREQVLQLIVAGVPSQRAATLVKQRGIDFIPDEEYLGTLRVAGADDALLAAVRAAGEAVTAEVTVITSPNAEVYVDGEAKGRADAQGELTIKSKPGMHARKISITGKEIQQWQVTLVAGKAIRVEARLEDVGPAAGDVKSGPKDGVKSVGAAAGPVKINPKDGLKYVWIPPGTFMMGCSPGDSGCSPHEKPPHQVTLREGFWMGATEVTVGAYKRYSNATGTEMKPDEYDPVWDNQQMPMVWVTWGQARAYCSWAGGRLPTEAEWEYAARAGSTEARHGPLDKIAWYESNSGMKAHEVAQKRANAFGLFDMLGNVWEWVNDWHGDRYYSKSPASDPEGPEDGQYRGARGGSFFEPSIELRSSNRGGYSTLFDVNTLGFRCVVELAP